MKNTILPINSPSGIPMWGTMISSCCSKSSHMINWQTRPPIRWSHPLHSDSRSKIGGFTSGSNAWIHGARRLTSRSWRRFRVRLRYLRIPSFNWRKTSLSLGKRMSMCNGRMAALINFRTMVPTPGASGFNLQTISHRRALSKSYMPTRTKVPRRSNMLMPTKNLISSIWWPASCDTMMQAFCSPTVMERGRNAVLSWTVVL